MSKDQSCHYTCLWKKKESSTGHSHAISIKTILFNTGVVFLNGLEKTLSSREF